MVYQAGTPWFRHKPVGGGGAAASGRRRLYRADNSDHLCGLWVTPLLLTQRTRFRSPVGPFLPFFFRGIVIEDGCGINVSMVSSFPN